MRRKKRKFTELSHQQSEQVHQLFMLLKYPTDHNTNFYLSTFRVRLERAARNHGIRDDDQIASSIAKLEQRIKRQLQQQNFQVKEINSCVHAFQKYCLSHFRYICLDMMRSMKRVARSLSNEGEITSRREGRMVLARNLINAIGPEINQLPKLNQTIIRLRYIHGQTNKRIARLLELSEVKVSRIHSQSLAILRAQLSEQPELLKLFNQMVG